MNTNQEYRNRTYNDAGVDRGIVKKAMVSILALMLALMLTLTSCGSVAEAGSAGEVTAQTSTEASYNAASKSEMFTREISVGEHLRLARRVIQRGEQVGDVHRQRSLG